jgi:hypothetical protein
LEVLQVPRLLKLLHGVNLLIYIAYILLKNHTIKVETVIFADVCVPSVVSWDNAGIEVALLIVLLHTRQVGYLLWTLGVHVQFLPGLLQLQPHGLSVEGGVQLDLRALALDVRE